jgi:hypothetical protein
MSVQSQDRLSRILLGSGNVAVYADPRTWKSTRLLSQLDFHEENGITHRIVIAPRAKLGGWVTHYERIKTLHLDIFVTFVAIEDLLDSDDPEGDFGALFTEMGRKRIILDDLEGFHSRKLGRLNFENSLVEKLVLTESTGIEVWEIFHSLKSSKSYAPTSRLSSSTARSRRRPTSTPSRSSLPSKCLWLLAYAL